MNGQEMLRAAEKHYEGILRMIQEHGHAITFMEGYDDNPPAAFTSGGAAKGLPDLLILGFPQESAGAFLNNAMKVIEPLWPFPNMTRLGGIANLDVVLRDVSKSNLRERKMLLTSMFNRRHGLSDTPILQICWPDKEGRFPFEPGCDPAYARVQRVKGLYA